MAKKSDITPPTITIKKGVAETIGNETDGYKLISFKLYDNIGLKNYEINGVIRELSIN